MKYKVVNIQGETIAEEMEFERDPQDGDEIVIDMHVYDFHRLNFVHSDRGGCQGIVTVSLHCLPSKRTVETVEIKNGSVVDSTRFLR